MIADQAARAHVYEVVVDQLAERGTRTTFGLMGEDTAALITDLDRRSIGYYHGWHENAATAMAEGYSWATGEVGVAIISRGPGLTNGLTAATTAAKAGHRLLIITAESSPGRESDLKIIGQRNMLEAVGVAYFNVTEPVALLDAFNAAWDAAVSGAASMLAIPQSVLHAPWAGIADRRKGSAGSCETAPTARHGDLRPALELLEQSSTPLIVVGRGGLGERAIYEGLAERIGALLGTTFLAKGLFAGSPLDVGVVGGFSDFSVRPVLRQVDCVLAFGASMNGFTRGHGTATPNARIAQFDIDPAAFGRYGPTDVAVTGDALMCAQLLLEGASAPDERRLHKPEILRAVADRDVFGPVDESNAEGIDPRVLTVALDRLLPADRLVITDGGHHLGFGATAMRVSEPGRARLTTDFAAVGMGLGTACGAAIGRPELATILFIGDGGLAMTLGDLETAVRFQLPLVAVVMNDRAYGAERHFLDLEGLPHHHSQFNDIDFAAVAGGLGMEAVTIRSTADVQACAPRLTQPETPLLLDCKINGAVRAQWLVDLDAARRSAEERSMSPA